MKRILFLLSIVTAVFTSCQKDVYQSPLTPESDSFMPLQIGNYWRVDSQNFSEIQDTVRIKGQLYYKMFSLTGGDAMSEDYLRIDANNNLISSSPRFPEIQYIRARFGANVGDTFQTLEDQSYNDYKVSVVEKSPTKMTFSFDMIYHPNFKGHPHTVTYIKGLGLQGGWKEIKINGKVYKQ
ncbi:hypothetical protein [Desertivirga brevis]|uniref:hypothetical protein n=1 Tax=Desertivirga brevis TaxID=2810310 RepID=UPI001A9582F2|nr:hypothetical protein [Pedobacter sp. SYSU D00873]